MRRQFKAWIVLLATLTLIGCGARARLSVQSGTGERPELPAPDTHLIPVVNIAPAKGWPAKAAPDSPEGFEVTAYASDLEHPRWLYRLPNGDILVAETNAPPKPDDAKGVKGLFMELAMKRAGAVTPSANRITLLRDTDGDGVVDFHSVFLRGLNSPFGMALIGSDFYVANSDAVIRFPYRLGDTEITAPGVMVAALPAGTINHHWTKNIIASADGRKLYATVGSNSNAAENGMQVEAERAAILEIDVQTGKHRVFASGLRNPNGMAWQGGKLWTVVNERDELGSDLVPDYLTSVVDGGFYGWPYSYYGQHLDERVKPQKPELVAKALVPDYALGPHTASLGLVSAEGNSLGFGEGMFIGQHGSWNRKPFSGYKVIFVPFKNGAPDGPPRDLLTGFLSEGGDAYGRPVGVVLDRQGALLVADDVGNRIWRVSKAAR